MLELTLSELVDRTVLSMAPNDQDKLLHIKSNMQMAPFDKLYDEVSDFITSVYIRDLYSDTSQKQIINILKRMKPLVASYCAYFAMDYLSCKDAKRNIIWGSKFIQNHYSCSNLEAHDIYNYFRSRMNNLFKTLSYADPMLNNPGYWKNNDSGKRPHLYSGQIIRYLQKHAKIDDRTKRRILLGVTPSVTLVAIYIGSYLPNGSYTNRTSTSEKDAINFLNSGIKPIDSITGKAIDTLFHLLSKKEYTFIGQNTGAKLYLYNDAKINYGKDQSGAFLINQTVSEDIFRLQRLNHSLDSIFYACKNLKQPLSKPLEYKLAGASSVCMSIPSPLFKYFKDDIECLINSIISNNRDYETASLRTIFNFTSVIFPYFVGILCYLLFFQGPQKIPVGENLYKILFSSLSNKNGFLHVIEDKVLKEKIGELIAYIKKTENNLLPSLSIQKNPLGNDNVKAISVNKGTNESTSHINKEFVWKDETHALSFSETLGIILNQQSNPAKNLTLVDENYWSFRNRFSYVEKELLKENITPRQFNRPMPMYMKTPPEYVAALAEAFSRDIHYYDR